MNLVDYSTCGILEERVYHSRINDLKELKECLLRPLDHSVIVAAIAQWRISRLSACVHASDGHFEHEFRTYNFLVFFVCFIETGYSKFD